MRHSIPKTWKCYFTVNGKMIHFENMKEAEGIDFVTLYKALQEDGAPTPVSPEDARAQYQGDAMVTDSVEANALLRAMALEYVTEDQADATVPLLDFGSDSERSLYASMKREGSTPCMDVLDMKRKYRRKRRR